MTAVKPSPNGRLTMPTVMLRSAGSGALVLLSVPAEAQSLYSRLEFWSDVLPTIVIAIVVFIVLRKKIRQQVASAPQDARRSPRERTLHRLSILFIVAPILYVVLIQGDLLWPIFAMMVTQPVAMIGVRPLGLPFGWRLACILPASLVSIFVGELVASWPRLTPLPAADQASSVLTACAASLALGALLSYLSFPPAYRDRAWP